MAIFINCSYQSEENNPVNIEQVFSVCERKSYDNSTHKYKYSILFKSIGNQTEYWNYPDEAIFRKDFDFIRNNDLSQLKGL